MNPENKFLSILIIVLLALSVLVACEAVPTQPAKTSKIAKFDSGEELLKAFEDARQSGSGFGYRGFGLMKGDMMVEEAAVAAPQAADTTTSGRDFSETNVQVKGVDEADIIKTDGDYIYTIAQGNLVIAKAYPADEAEILSTTKLGDFYPNELFIDKNRLLIFGSTSYNFETPKAQEENQGETPEQGEIANAKMMASIRAPDYYPYYGSFMTVKLYDTSDREEPELLRTVDFEGSYLTSRKIGEYDYFVVNSYPRYWDVRPLCEGIVPLYREATSDEKP